MRVLGMLINSMNIHSENNVRNLPINTRRRLQYQTLHPNTGSKRDDIAHGVYLVHYEKIYTEN
jgi:hypothetical protein